MTNRKAYCKIVPLWSFVGHETCAQNRGSMRIVLGYIAVFAYVFFLIFVLGEFVRKRTNLETSRKTIHTMLFMVWVLIDVFFKNSIHQILVPVAFLILNSLSFKFRIYKSVERENNNHYGTVYFAIAITAVMTLAYFFEELYLASGAAAFCLTAGDGFAALVGYNTRSRRIRGNKTLNGFIACFAAALLALVCFRLVWWPEMGLPEALILSALSAVAELTGRGLDNFTITFSVFGTSWLLVDVLRQPDGSQAAVWAVVIFLIVFFSRAIDYAGALLSMLIVFAFRYCAGAAGLGYLLGTYFVVFFIGLAKKTWFKSAGKTRAHERNWLQILINGGLGTLAVVFYGIYQKPWLLASAAAIIGGCFIDSVSSDVGTLSPRDPYDIIRRLRVPKGISGGISVAGTAAAAVCAIGIGAYCFFAFRFSAAVSTVICLLTFAQTLADSILGSLVQVKYRCAVCGCITENRIHCDTATQYRSGLKLIDNNMVNLLSSALIALLAAGIFRVLI